MKRASTLLAMCLGFIMLMVSIASAAPSLTVVKGAVITYTGEDYFKYRYKCESCGNVENWEQETTYNSMLGGQMTKKYHCIHCNNDQIVKITLNNPNVPQTPTINKDMQDYYKEMFKDVGKDAGDPEPYSQPSILNQTDEIKVVVNGKTLQLEQKPVNLSGRVMVPIRAVSEELGAEVLWDGETGTITINSGETTVRLKLNDVHAYINGEEFTLSDPPMVFNERTVVPLRFVGEALGAQVNWDGSTSTVSIELNK